MHWAPFVLRRRVSFAPLLFLLAEKFACNTFRLTRKKYFFRKLFTKEEGQSEKRAKHRQVGCVPKAFVPTRAKFVHSKNAFIKRKHAKNLRVFFISSIIYKFARTLFAFIPAFLRSGLFLQPLFCCVDSFIFV